MLNQEVVKFYSGFPLQVKDSTVIDDLKVRSTETNFPYIERIAIDPKIHFGKPVVKGTRITVQNIIELVVEGLTFDQITKDYYPDITKDDVRACLKYANALVGAEDIHISSVST